MGGLGLPAGRCSRRRVRAGVLAAGVPHWGAARWGAPSGCCTRRGAPGCAARPAVCRRPGAPPPPPPPRGLGSGLGSPGRLSEGAAGAAGPAVTPLPGGVGGARVGTAGKGLRGWWWGGVGGAGQLGVPGRSRRRVAPGLWDPRGGGGGGGAGGSPGSPALPEQMAPGVSAGALLTLFSAGPGSRLAPRPTEGRRGPVSPPLRGHADLRGVTVTLPGVAAGSQQWVRGGGSRVCCVGQEDGCLEGGAGCGRTGGGGGGPCQLRAPRPPLSRQACGRCVLGVLSWGAGSPGSPPFPPSFPASVVPGEVLHGFGVPLRRCSPSPSPSQRCLVWKVPAGSRRAFVPRVFRE